LNNALSDDLLGNDNASADLMTPQPLWWRWAQLVRLPTVFTVIAQVVAAFLVAAGTAEVAIESSLRLGLILLAAIAVYWAGMILNDVWDFQEDLRDRPKRPLPSGQIGLSQARTVAWSLLAVSIVMAGISGVVATADRPVTLAPVIIASVLSVCVVMYNGPLKSTPVAPIAMGVCRMLCFLLGASPLVVIGAAEFMQPQTWFADHVVTIAVGFGVYITGITTVSRLEAGDQPGDGRSWDLNVGMLVTLFGAAAIALAPRVAPAGTPWVFVPNAQFILLIGLITFPLVIRAFRVSADPRPELIQNLVRMGVLNVIPYSAALTLLVAGSGWALAIFSLAIMAMVSAVRLRVT